MAPYLGRKNERRKAIKIAPKTTGAAMDKVTGLIPYPKAARTLEAANARQSTQIPEGT